jgi:hypothetical protein
MKMPYIIMILLFMLVTACEQLGVNIQRSCSKPDKEGYSTCQTVLTDHPACVGSCAKP